MLRPKTIPEVRLEILREARDILMIDYYQKEQSARSEFDYFIGQRDVPAAKAVVFPKPVTYAEILALAGEILEFTS